MAQSSYDQQIEDADVARRALLAQRDDAVAKQVAYEALPEEQRLQTPPPTPVAVYEAPLRQNEELLEYLHAARATELRDAPTAPEAPRPASEIQAPPQLPEPTAWEKGLQAADAIIPLVLQQSGESAIELVAPGGLDSLRTSPAEDVVDLIKDQVGLAKDYAAGLAITTIDNTFGDGRLAEAQKQAEALEQKHDAEAAKLEAKLAYAQKVQEERIAEGLTKDPEGALEQTAKIAEAARAELAQRQAAELARQLQEQERARQLSNPDRDHR